MNKDSPVDALCAVLLQALELADAAARHEVAAYIAQALEVAQCFDPATRLL